MIKNNIIKNLTIILACGFMAGCAGNCLSQTSVASATLGEVMYQGNLAYDANYIGKSDFKKVVEGVEQTKVALDTARLMCVTDNKSFDTQFKLVEQGITRSLTLLDENKKEPVQ